MALTGGARLGPYETLSALGAGATELLDPTPPRLCNTDGDPIALTLTKPSGSGRDTR